VSTDIPQNDPTPAGPAETGTLRSLPARAIGLVTSPRSVFEELRVKPSWFWTTMVLVVFGIVLSIVIYDPVLYPMFMEQAETQAQSSEQLAQIEDFYGSPAAKYGMSFLFGGVMNLISVVVTGLLMFAICGMLLGGKVTVRQGFSVAAHAFLVHIPRALILLPIMFSQQDPRFSLGPGALFPPRDAIGFGQNFLASFLSGLDLFNIWALALCILGMSVITGLPSRKIGVPLSIGYLIVIVFFSVLAGFGGPK
jgi:hypothetical protein